jgi:two-component system response regulator FixJ
MLERGANEPRVYVVDDEADVRDSVTLLLRSVALRTATFADAAGFLDAYRPETRPACLLTDLRMPGMCGLELFLALRQRGCRMPAVIMTGHGEVGVAVRAMKAGVFDFIEKPFRGQDLIEVVQQALRRCSQNIDEAASRREVEVRAATLTPREREVMALVVRGERNKAIARELDLSVRTVELHRARIMEKLGVRTLSDLVRMGMMLPEAETES